MSTLTTSTPRADPSTEDGRQSPTTITIPTAHEQHKVSSAKKSTNLRADENNNDVLPKDVPQRSNSVDPALEIKGIFKTPLAKESRGNSPTKPPAIDVQDFSET